MTTLVPKFKQSGTGAVNRAINLKLAETISVLDFGADPTGVADSTTAIQAAINYAQTVASSVPTIVYFPTGNYKTTAALNITKAIWLRGQSVGTTKITITSASIVPVISVLTSLGTGGLLGGGISDLYVDGGVNCDGIVIRAVSSQAISRYVVENIAIYNCRDGLNISSDSGNIVYQSIFSNILINNFTRYGMFLNTIAYNTFQNIEATNTTTTAYSFYALATASCYFGQLTCDGVCYFDAAQSNIDQFTIETLYAATPLTGTCLNINAIASIKNIFLIEIDNAKCPYAINLGSSNFHLSDVTFYNSVTTSPQYPLSFSANGSGIVENFVQGSGDRIEVYTSAANLLNYKFINSPTLTKISNLGTNLISSTSTLSSVVISGTAGQFTCASTVLTLGQAIVLSGTYGGTGSITGYTNPKTYYIIATNGTTTFTLSDTSGGSAITTTAGTPTGITYTLAILPTPSEKYRGNMLVLLGSAGLTDHTYVCQKNASDVYTWVQIDN